MTTVYIVLGENGEYSSRQVFVSGVFATEKEAQDAVLAASEHGRVWEIWNDAFYKLCLHFDRQFDFNRPDQWRDPPEKQEERKQLHAKARELAGPEPEYERGARFEIVCMEIGTWKSADGE